MKTPICHLLIYCLSSAAFCEPGQPDSPALARTVSAVEEIVPKGWELLDHASGDLNKDMKDDHVVVITTADTSDKADQYHRILIVLLAAGDRLEVSAVSKRAVLPAGAGGILGDPFESVAIERQTFVVSHFGGSRERWSFKHRYRFQDEGWFLIGRTEKVFDSITGKFDEKDENLVTGRTIEISGERDSSTKSINEEEPVQLIDLEKFDFAP